MTARPSPTGLLFVLLGGLSLACGGTVGGHGGDSGDGGNAGTGTAGTGAGTAGTGGTTAGASGTGVSGRGGSAGGTAGVGAAGTGGSGSAGTGAAGVTGRAGTTGGAGTTGRGGTTGTAGTTGGAGTTGSAGTTGGAGTTGSAGAGGGADVCARWKADRADLAEGTWTGDVASCNAGDMGAAARANALRLVNLYRWLAALPPVTTDPARDAKDQACALMMRANNTITHDPPETWTCYTQDGADAAGNSNVSSGRAVTSVDLYMTDPGNATTIGHRRWILSNSLGPIGIGGTDRASCMWTLGGTGKAGKTWMAWPAPGTIPLQAITTSRGSLDTTGWTVQSDSINLAGAQVTVTVDGASQPVTVTQLDPNYGSRYAIRFNPSGWQTQAGKTYVVAVTGIPTPINYSVEVVSCQ